ncbi:unnamed protein product [Ectocarpus sp. CCAP 1310/34]|nr:unnamed protein product [Ectocarpus sp. CCAP 1310/34]
MATEEAKVVDAVPPPPAYYKLFSPGASLTGQDVGASAAIAAPGDSAGGAGGTAPNEFPLQPPRPPGPGETYRMFGMPYSSEPVEQELLPPEKIVVPASGQAIDFRAGLKGLLNSIMANYGQFMEMLVSSPARAHEKLSDVETLFVNFHSLLNRYRAHQARHIVLERLRSQAEENDAVMSTLEAAMHQCTSAQESAFSCLGLQEHGASCVAEGERERAQQGRVEMDIDETIGGAATTAVGPPKTQDARGTGAGTPTVGRVLRIGPGNVARVLFAVVMDYENDMNARGSDPVQRRF